MTPRARPARTLSRAHALLDDLICGLGLVNNRNLATANDFALARALDFAVDLSDALGRDLVTAHELTLARDLAQALVRTLSSAHTRRLSYPFKPDFDRGLARALDLAGNLASLLSRDLTCEGSMQADARRVAPSAAKLLDAVTRLLPAPDRARYAEEFRSELWDLAQAGAGSLRQLAYALRQLRNAHLTGSALRSPRHRGAVL